MFGHNVLDRSDVLDRSMESQLVSLYADRENLERHFGFSDPAQMVDMVDSLVHQLRDFYDHQSSGQTVGEQGTSITSMLEAQLSSLYAERQELIAELGVSDASDLISMVRNLEAQLHSLYVEREVAEILNHVRQLEVQMRAFSGAKEMPEVVTLVSKLTNELSTFCATHESHGLLRAA